MRSDPSGWEPAQLRDFRAEFQANPALCRATLAVLGEPTPEPERILIRTDSESVDLAICRALAMAVEGIKAKIELVAG